jgi:hypothetical protein
MLAILSAKIIQLIIKRLSNKSIDIQFRVECTLFCNLQIRARSHAALVIGLYELLGNRTNSLSHPDPHFIRGFYLCVKLTNQAEVARKTVSCLAFQSVNFVRTE